MPNPYGQPPLDLPIRPYERPLTVDSPFRTDRDRQAAIEDIKTLGGYDRVERGRTGTSVYPIRYEFWSTKVNKPPLVLYGDKELAHRVQGLRLEVPTLPSEDEWEGISFSQVQQGDEVRVAVTATGEPELILLAANGKVQEVGNHASQSPVFWVVHPTAGDTVVRINLKSGFEYSIKRKVKRPITLQVTGQEAMVIVGLLDSNAQRARIERASITEERYRKIEKELRRQLEAQQEKR